MCKIPVYKYTFLLLSISFSLIPFTQSKFANFKVVDENGEVFETYPTMAYQIEHQDMSLQMILEYQFYNIDKKGEDDPFEPETELLNFESLADSGLRKIVIKFQKYDIIIGDEGITYSFGEVEPYEIFGIDPCKNAQMFSDKIDELGLTDYGVTEMTYLNEDEEDHFDFKYITTEDMEAIKESEFTDWNFVKVERIILI